MQSWYDSLSLDPLFVSLLCSGAFAGIGYGCRLAQSLIQHPENNAKSVLNMWRAMFDHNVGPQLTLVLLGSAAGLLKLYQEYHPCVAVGTIALFLNLPFTRIILWPTNVKLFKGGAAEKMNRDLVVQETRRWQSLHLIRIGLGVVAFLSFSWAAINKHQ
eukprot:TRINITY_DN25176_c0_g1_i1.p1 TRINITY_DN25176_c0_g1~~TRINITY_DN25176_c0_g1_i1.p1  ORF type:complete len:159 (+),score=10.02 TRINITY_DN25176_c0_g1_i1:117-593(+)